MDIKRNDSISVIVHDLAVVGPIPASNMSLAKGLAAERAKEVLGDPNSPYRLSYLCDCAEEAKAAEAARHAEEAVDGVEAKKLDDETEEGFAALAQIVLTGVQTEEASPTAVGADSDEDEVAMDIEVEEEMEMEIDTEANVDTAAGNEACACTGHVWCSDARWCCISTVSSSAGGNVGGRYFWQGKGCGDRSGKWSSGGCRKYMGADVSRMGEDEG